MGKHRLECNLLLDKLNTLAIELMCKNRLQLITTINEKLKRQSLKNNCGLVVDWL